MRSLHYRIQRDIYLIFRNAKAANILQVEKETQAWLMVHICNHSIQAAKEKAWVLKIKVDIEIINFDFD